MATGKLILKGFGNPNGPREPITCKVRIIREDVEQLKKENKNPITPALMAVQPGECLVSENFIPAQNKWLEVASALIQDAGGSSSHAVLWSQEQGIPCVYNIGGVQQEDGNIAHSAVEDLHDGQEIVVMGYTHTEEYTKSSGVRGQDINYGGVYEHTQSTEPTLAEKMALIEKYKAKFKTQKGA